MLLRLFLIIFFFEAITAQEYIWCGVKDCYSILQISRDATLQQIKHSYYMLSLKYHPDKNKTKEAAEIFIEIANAYSVLSDPSSRKLYDDVLANPELYHRHLMRFYTHYYHTSPFMVLLGLFILWTILDYVYHYYTHYSVIESIKRMPVYQRRVRDLKTNNFADIVDIQTLGWKGHPPTFYDFLFVRAFFWPLIIIESLYSSIRWIVKFSLLHYNYGYEEENYLTRNILDISEENWELMEEAERKNLISRRLWIPENLFDFRRGIRSKMKNKYK